MSQKNRPRRERQALPPRRVPRAVWWGGALVLAVGALFVLLSSGSKPATVSAQGPRLAVDTQEMDLGKVPVEKMVTATFTIRNVGDAPLRILNEPQVRVVEGC